MGFVVKSTLFVLQFAEGHALHGSEIRVRSASIGKLLGLMDMADALRGGKERNVKETARTIDELFTQFSERLVSWDLQEEPLTPGAELRDIPCTKEGLYELDLDVVLDIVFAWVDGVTAVSGPLEQNSNGGGQSEQPPMTMETLEPLLSS